MFRIVALILFFVTSLSFFACHSSSTGNTGEKDSLIQKAAREFDVRRAPEDRKEPKKEAVVEYKEKMKSDLNDHEFSVHLFETGKTNYYRVKMQSGTLIGEDTVKLPDLGTEPRPVLQKGKDRYSCIIGFMDNEDSFREYKLVYVKGEGDALSIKTLKHYRVSSHFRLETQ
ncbi:hypothetical protein ACX0G9_27300 [Flavitalea flava]